MLQRKKAFWAKYNGEKRKGFGKIHTKKNILGKILQRKKFEGILGKIQWRKA